MLEVRNLSFSVSKRPILLPLSFEAEAGNFYVLLGANGAGKSTLIKLLSNEYEVSGGSVLWKGRPLSSYKIREIAKERAVMTQKVHLSNDFDTEEIVMMGRYPHFASSPREEDRHVVRKVIEETGISAFTGKPYHQLSGGEQQRVQFARVLAQLEEAGPEAKGKLMLLDEPLNNLDVKYRHLILSQAKAFARKGNSVIMVMHDINLAARYADRILLLKKGRLMTEGKPSEVIRDEILSLCYDCPARVAEHPFYENCPVVFFEDRGIKNEVLGSSSFEEIASSA